MLLSVVGVQNDKSSESSTGDYYLKTASNTWLQFLIDERSSPGEEFLMPFV
jgi:hypothetical protein